jgi:DNA-binding transcriptional MerR regulator
VSGPAGPSSASPGPSSAPSTASSSPGPRVNIGDVLELLRPDFPTISIPKIRFLEEKGIVTPERTSAGYRKFSHADVERLRYALTLQRDHHQPLARIVEILDAIDRGLEPPPLVDLTPTVPAVDVTPDGLPSPESFRRSDDLRLSRRELLKVADIPEPLLVSLEEHGLVAPMRGSASHYDSDALVVCTTARELSDFGLEPRHLRAFKNAADREVGLVEQVVAPTRRSSSPSASARADDAVAQLAALSVRLHATLVRAGLRRL